MPVISQMINVCLFQGAREHSEEGGRERSVSSCNECGSYYTHLFMVGLSDERRLVPFFRRFICRARLLVFGSHPLTGKGFKYLILMTFLLLSVSADLFSFLFFFQNLEPLVIKVALLCKNILNNLQMKIILN